MIPWVTFVSIARAGLYQVKELTIFPQIKLIKIAHDCLENDVLDHVYSIQDILKKINDDLLIMDLIICFVKVTRVCLTLQL